MGTRSTLFPWRRAEGEPARSLDELVADLASTCHAVLTAPALAPDPGRNHP